MGLMTKDERKRLIKNGRIAWRDGEPEIDFVPVVRLWCPWSKAEWLLTEIHPDDKDLALGLGDFGWGVPDFAAVRISDLKRAKGPYGLRIQRDPNFRPERTISEYAEIARDRGRIIVPEAIAVRVIMRDKP